MPIDIDKRNFFSRRTSIITSLKIFFSTIIIGKLAQLQIFSYKKYKQLSIFNSMKMSIIPSMRGDIFDRNDNVLASSIKYISAIYSNVPLKTRNIEIIRKFYNILYNDPIRTEANVQRVVKFSKNNPSLVIVLIKKLTQEEIEKINFFIFDLPSVEIIDSFGRNYNHGSNFSHVLGYVQKPTKKIIEKTDNLLTKEILKSPSFQIGAFGIELIENEWLSGEVGINGIHVGNTGKIVKKSLIREQTNGNDIKLTIDLKIQDEIVKNFEGKLGGCVVLDVESGEILGMYSSPGFDPNIFEFSLGNSEKISNILTDPDNVMQNRCLTGLYPPGSTFKPISALCGLINGWDSSTKIHCNGTFKYGKRTYHCWKEEGHGKVDLNKAIAQSCNVYFYNMAKEIEINDLYRCAKDLRFGQRYNLGFGTEYQGIIPNREWKKKRFDQVWFPGETMNSIIGQGYNQVNILQLAVAAARIATNGVEVKPTIWKDFIKKNNLNVDHVGKMQSKSKNYVNSAYFEYLKIIQNGMHDCVNADYGALYRFGKIYSELQVCGKTGTAQTISRRIDADLMRGSAKNFAAHGLFFGYAPYDKPKFAISVVVEKGVWGSTSAAPIAMEILKKAMQG